MRPILLTPILAVALAVGGCGSSSDDGAAQPGTQHLPRGSEPVDLDPASFTTEIDNRYWPMDPGTRWTYREVDENGR